MKQLRGWRFPALFLFAAAALLFPGPPAVAEELRADRISFESERLQTLATDKFMELLGIRPGMTILDIGTGTGQWAYRFAEKLAGTGKVYATDIDKRCISFVREEAKRRGLDNLIPVLVKPKGVDDFYGQHRYDVITMFHVPIRNLTGFLSRMRRYMAEDGRLIVVRYGAASSFSQEDFGDHFPELLGELSREPGDSPFLKGLRETTRELLRQHSGAQPPDMLRMAVVEDFNRMLSDEDFSRDFLDGPTVQKQVDFTPAERQFAEAQLDVLNNPGASEGNPKKDKAGLSTYVRRLNKLLFFQRFRKYLDAKRLFAPVLNPTSLDSYTKAGFRLEKEDRVIWSFEDIGVFRPEKQAAGQ